MRRCCGRRRVTFSGLLPRGWPAWLRPGRPGRPAGPARHPDCLYQNDMERHTWRGNTKRGGHPFDEMGLPLATRPHRGVDLGLGCACDGWTERLRCSRLHLCGGLSSPGVLQGAGTVAPDLPEVAERGPGGGRRLQLWYLVDRVRRERGAVGW